MEFTDSQKRAFDEITAKANGLSEHLLIGYAGTGKTFLMGTIAGYFIATGASVAVTAPTHKATAVLADKVPHEGVLCCTIHSLLSLVPKEDETGTRLVRRQFAKNPEIDVVIIDECSMLSVELMAWIRRLLRNSLVLFVGDDAQLPPVGEEKSLSFQVKSRSVLEQIVRQGEGNPILEAAYACRKSQESGIADWSFLAPKSIGKTGLFRPDDTDRWMRKAFLSSDFAKNPNEFRYLAWTNAKVDAVNKQIQYWLFGDIRTPFAPGELVISKKRFVGEGFEVQNSEEMKLTSIEESTFKTNWREYGYDGEEIAIPSWTARTDKGYAIRIIRDRKSYNDALGIVRKKCNGWQTLEGQGAYGHVVAFQDAFGRLSANYAMTVHTSQGSTFRCEFMDTNDILKRQKDNLLEAQQLVYVGLTRPTDMVFLV